VNRKTVNPQPCIFCRIVTGEAPASIVYEDDIVVAFLDTRPINAGHTLIIPRRHAVQLADMQPLEAAPTWEAARKVTAGLRTSGLRCDGVNFHLADGAAAGQEVMHVHLHVIPRWRNDGAGLRRPPGFGTQPPRAELDVIANAIRSHIRGDRRPTTHASHNPRGLTTTVGVVHHRRRGIQPRRQ
jgi:diadenosine tetraphosphate (Ap4A) HIT family hydrolase